MLLICSSCVAWPDLIILDLSPLLDLCDPPKYIFSWELNKKWASEAELGLHETTTCNPLHDGKKRPFNTLKMVTRNKQRNLHSHSKPNKTFTAHKVKCDFHLDLESASFLKIHLLWFCTQSKPHHFPSTSEIQRGELQKYRDELAVLAPTLKIACKHKFPHKYKKICSNSLKEFWKYLPEQMEVHSESLSQHHLCKNPDLSVTFLSFNKQPTGMPCTLWFLFFLLFMS